MKSKSRKSLGRGIEYLFSENYDAEDFVNNKKEKVNTIPIEQIEPNPFQPRTIFNELALKELTESENGIGLAANQIGINKRVCVVNVKEPLVLINPRIVERSEEQFVFAEGCLSFPGKHVRTGRHVSVIVETDNHEGKLSFSAESEDVNDAFECACVQHEIDHLDGITMFDRSVTPQPY